MPNKADIVQNASLIDINENNRELLKRLVQVCFPISYKDEFYTKVACLYRQYSRFIILKDIVVGAIVCRVEEDEATKQPFLHLLILLVLKKYRKFGLASKLMAFIEERLRETDVKLTHVQLHVQKVNTGAVEFYKTVGFEVAQEIPGYYTDLEQSDALLMKKSFSEAA